MSTQDTPQIPGSTEPPLEGSLSPSANGSREGSISSPNIHATSAASGVTMRNNLPANGSSSSSSGSDELIMQERAMLEREIFHLRQQNAQTQQQLAHTLHALDHMRSSGVSPSVAMPHFGNLPPTPPSMTNRVHLNNNGAAVTHEHDQIQLSNLGMMNGTAYHSSVSAYTLPGMSRNPHCPPMFSPRQQVFNSRESVDIWQASPQSEMMNFAPLGSNNFDANSQRSTSHGRQSPTNFLSGGQVSMSMLEGDPQFLFANLVEHYRTSSLDDVKRGLFPILLHKICLTGIAISDAHQILHVILESSDFFEVLRMRCFDQVLLQRIHVAKNERARVAGPKFLP